MRGLTRFIYRWVAAVVSPRNLASLVELPRYVSHWRQYSALSDTPISLADSYPRLTDWHKTTPFDPHYFYQAAWLARRLAQSAPQAHCDIGSDVGLVGVLSAFIPTDFIDFRPLAVDLAGLNCLSGDITKLSLRDSSIESLSCMHVIEHIGLGRYGDPVDPNGSRLALAELQRVLSPGGRLYISVPVGRQRVEFNAHRVFDPQTILDLLPGMRLVEFSLVDDNAELREHSQVTAAKGLAYGCGLFVLEKE